MATSRQMLGPKMLSKRNEMAIPSVSSMSEIREHSACSNPGMSTCNSGTGGGGGKYNVAHLRDFRALRLYLSELLTPLNPREVRLVYAGDSIVVQTGS